MTGGSVAIVLAGAKAIGTRPAGRSGPCSSGAASRAAAAMSCSRVIGTSGGRPCAAAAADGAAGAVAIGTSRGICCAAANAGTSAKLMASRLRPTPA